jgi:hypothetical protein
MKAAERRLSAVCVKKRRVKEKKAAKRCGKMRLKE